MSRFESDIIIWPRDFSIAYTWLDKIGNVQMLLYDKNFLIKQLFLLQIKAQISRRYTYKRNFVICLSTWIMGISRCTCWHKKLIKNFSFKRVKISLLFSLTLKFGKCKIYIANFIIPHSLRTREREDIRDTKTKVALLKIKISNIEASGRKKRTTWKLNNEKIRDVQRMKEEEKPRRRCSIWWKLEKWGYIALAAVIASHNAHRVEK